MSPVTGSRGYEDYQRVSNWDAPILGEGTKTSLLENFPLEFKDVSRYAYLYLRIRPTSAEKGLLLLHLDYWNHPLGGLNCGERDIVLTPEIKVPIQIRVPNLGPFVTIRLTRIEAAGGTCDFQIAPTNRYVPIEVIPSAPTLINEIAKVVLKAGNIKVWPLSYFAGPAVFYFSPAGEKFSLLLRYVDKLGEFHTFSTLSPAAGSNTKENVVLPVGAWFAEVLNAGAADSQFDLSLIPSLTGST